MQKYPDSGPSVVREGFQGAPAPAPAALGAVAPTVVPAPAPPAPWTLGDLLTFGFYKTNVNDVRGRKLSDYTDAKMNVPIYSDWFGYGDVYISNFVFVTHIVLALIAVYFSIREFCGFNPKMFFIALICPYFYLPYHFSLYGLRKTCAQVNINLKKNEQAIASAD